MDLFDIVGPVMVGPSSSHTAGAVRIGYVAGKLLGEDVRKANILLYGSFLATGNGHGTKRLLLPGFWACTLMITGLQKVFRLQKVRESKSPSARQNLRRPTPTR